MYKKNKFQLFLLLTLFLLASTLAYSAEDKLTIYSPNYFGEQNNVYEDIHFLENEALSFDFCTEPDAKNIRFYIACGSSEEDIQVVKNYNKPGCYFSNYNLRDIQCSQFSLFINYDVGSKKKIVKRTFIEQRESLLVNYILEKDYKSLNDLDLSYYLIVLNDIQDKSSAESIDAYEELKNSRNNDNKCWPENNCNLDTTTSILRNLKMATYSADSRMLEDGKIYLERKVIEDPQGTSSSNEVIDYEFEIDILNPPSATIECDLETDGGNSRSYEFASNSDFEDLRIEKTVTNNIFLTCNDDIDEISLKLYQSKIYDKEYSVEDKITYTIDSTSLMDYSDFKYRIRIDHNFAVGEEIECEFAVDDSSAETYTFDEDSDFEDLLFEDYFDNEFVLDCDDNFDFIKVDVYADIEEEIIFENEDEIDYDVNVASDEEFDFKIFVEYDFLDNEEELLCSLEIDNSRTKNYRFKESSVKSGIITIDNQKAASSVKFTCEKDIDKAEFNLFDIFNRKQIDMDYANIKTFAYTIPAGFSDYECIGESGSCLYSGNVNSLIAFGTTLSDSASFKKFVDSFITEGSNNELFIYDSNAIIDTGKYLYYNNNNDLVNYMKFEQNNDGSWGVGSNVDKIIHTSWAVIGVQEVDKSSEHVEDGKKWIYYNEPLSGWGTIEKNGLAYYAIKEKLKPYLKITTENEIAGYTKFEVENPTIYNLKDVKIKFENKLDDYISFTQNLGDLEGQDYREFNLTSKNSVVGDKTGMMIITGVDGKNKEIELLKMPINVKGITPFEIKKQNLTVTIENKYVNIIKSNILDSYSYDCTYINPFTGKSETTAVTETVSRIQLANEDMKVGGFNFDMKCVKDKEEFIVPLSINVQMINKTIEIKPASLYLESYNDFSISVTNIGGKIETITFGVGGDYLGYINPAENSKTLAVGETRDVYFTIPYKELMQALSQNATGYLLVRTSEGFEKRIPVLFFVVPEVKTGLAWYWYAIIGVLAFALIAFLVWRRQHIMAEQQEASKQNSNDEFQLDEFDF